MQGYRSLFLCLFIVSGATRLHAQTGVNPPQARIQFENPVYNFGRLKAGGVVTHSFVFTNTGSADLEIISVKPGCGCTTAGTWEKTIAPGKTGSIPLQLNSTGFGGVLTKSATVTCNDPTRSNVVLQLTGTIWKPLEIMPTIAAFNFPADGQTHQSRAIRITSNIEEPVTLEAPIVTNSAIQAELRTLKPGKEFELVVTALPPFTNAYSSTPIKIKTSSKEVPEISTSAYVTVQPVLSVVPQFITLPAGPTTTNTRPSIVNIRNNGSTDVSLSDPAINVQDATVSLKEMQPGRAYQLSVALPIGYQANPSQRAEVTVKTSHPKHPLLRVPINQTMSLPVTSPAAKLAPAK